MRQFTNLQAEVQEAISLLKALILPLEPSCAGYLTGSYAGGYANPGVSDLDISIVVPEAEDSLRSFLNSPTFIDKVAGLDFEADLMVVSANRLGGAVGNDILTREAIWSALLSGRRIWGPEYLENSDFFDHADYHLETSRAYLEFITRCLGEIHEPSDIDAARIISELRGGGSTKPFVSLTTFSATTILAFNHNVKVGSKMQAIEELMSLDPISAAPIQRSFRFCRDDLGYLLPDTCERSNELEEVVTQNITAIKFSYKLAKEYIENEKR